jgi:diguanylate cyclase (GGDEF)-like protein
MVNPSQLHSTAVLPLDNPQAHAASGERHFAELIRDGILVTNEAFHPLWMNSSLRRMLDIEPDVSLSTHDVLLACGMTSLGAQDLMETSRLQGRWNGSVLVNQDGIPNQTSLEVTRDGNRWVFFFGDTRSRNLAESRWRQESKQDALTGLPNRSAFHEHLSMAMAAAEFAMGYVAVMLVDIDRFKVINDGLGYATGDELLKECAHRIGKAINGNGEVFRHGGDEFVVLMPGGSSDYARACAEQIKKAMEQPFALHDHELSISCSVGISIFPDHGCNAVDLLKHSDVALHHAKGNGRNCISLYQEEMSERAARAFAIENGLKCALQKGEFHLEYQLQVDVANRKICGAEALIRWNHPQLGRVPPDQFIPRAEDMRLMGEISDWVFETAADQLNRWHRDGIAIPKVAINLSATQLTDLHLPERLLSLAVKHGVHPGTIELELTESSMMEDMERCLTILHGLRKLGFRIAVDDFGTGHSSLRYLKFLPISKIKIDRAFIQGVPVDAGDIALTKTIITLAQSMNLEVLAEGVEDRAQVDFLLASDCPEIQGYIFAKPVKPDQIAEAISRAMEALGS